VTKTLKLVDVSRVRSFTYGVCRPHVARDDHAAQLVDDEHVQLGRRLAELLLQDLQDGLHHPGGVPQGHGDVTQGPDGVIWDQVSVPVEEVGLQHALR